jgi:glycosyltransferase involved in cell wall biosynthesis
MPELYQTLGDLACDHWISRVLRRVEKASIAFAHLAITPNQAFREVFVGRSCSPDKMHVVMNSPEEDVFHPGVEQALAELSRPPGDQPFRILFHGSLVHRHGLDTAVEAVVAAMPEVGSVHLYICGWRTPYLDSVLELAQDRGIGDRVHYLGARSLDEIARLIAGVDLGVIPNRRSPFTEINMPTRIFEYLAVGKPVVAPSTRGIRDYFGEDDLIFFNPGDAEDLARQFVRVHHSPDAVARIVARGRAVYERHRWQVNRREFLRLTAALLENRLVASVSLGLSSAETNPLASVPPGQVRS